MKVGIEQWLERANPALKVGLLSHQAALLSTGETSAEALRRVFGENLVALFGPEHGFFGAAAAGERTPTLRHPAWGIPVHSLYGECRKPTPDMLRGLDLLVVDLQDLGVRCYTYLATLKLALEACAELGLPCLVCDRPLPLYGLEDGPIAEPEHFSFVAPCALPFVHGKTHTEVAAWLGLPHEAAPVQSALPGPQRPDGAPEFLPPSPAIRSWTTAQLYPTLVFAEALPQLDIARNTPYAFRTLSAPWIDGAELTDALHGRLPGLRAFDFSQPGGVGGIRLHLADFATYRPWKAAMTLLRTLRALYGDDRLFGHPDARPAWMTKLCGTRAWEADLLP